MAFNSAFKFDPTFFNHGNNQTTGNIISADKSITTNPVQSSLTTNTYTSSQYNDIKLTSKLNQYDEKSHPTNCCCYIKLDEYNLVGLFNKLTQSIRYADTLTVILYGCRLGSAAITELERFLKNVKCADDNKYTIIFNSCYISGSSIDAFVSVTNNAPNTFRIIIEDNTCTTLPSQLSQNLTNRVYWNNINIDAKQALAKHALVTIYALLLSYQQPQKLSADGFNKFIDDLEKNQIKEYSDSFKIFVQLNIQINNIKLTANNAAAELSALAKESKDHSSFVNTSLKYDCAAPDSSKDDAAKEKLESLRKEKKYEQMIFIDQKSERIPGNFRNEINLVKVLHYVKHAASNAITLDFCINQKDVDIHKVILAEAVSSGKRLKTLNTNIENFKLMTHSGNINILGKNPPKKNKIELMKEEDYLKMESQRTDNNNSQSASKVSKRTDNSNSHISSSDADLGDALSALSSIASILFR